MKKTPKTALPIDVLRTAISMLGLHDPSLVVDRKPWCRVLYIQVLIAVFLGIVVGYVNPGLDMNLRPLGDGFVSLVKMIIAPIIFCTVVHGIASMSDLKKLGRVGIKALVYFEIVSTLAPNRQGWQARVLTCSALENTGISEIWQMILDHRAHQEAGGHLQRKRQAQALNWMHELISTGLKEIFQNAAAVQERLAGLEHCVRERTISPSMAARELLGLYQI